MKPPPPKLVLISIQTRDKMVAEIDRLTELVEEQQSLIGWALELRKMEK